MQKYYILFFLFFSQFGYSQKQYFQQEVDYTIDVRLNDKSHILYGFEKINYRNNSDDTLKFLFFHLWPNAYRNDKSAFCEQMVENKQTKFYFSKPDQRGFIDSLEFKVNGENVNKSDYNNNPDIVVLELLNPILPHSNAEITTPFRVVLPEVFSRLGHHNQTYQISQWYPKPAVYDRFGWHPMPYLDQGEFYSEFGSFTVNITLPQNYVVAATGDLQNDAEFDFLKTRMLQNDSTLTEKLKTIPETSPTFKTITFKQKNVHDFAWFADKQFIIEQSIDTLPNQKLFSSFSFFPPSMIPYYKGSSKITAKTIKYLSKHVGAYPYNQASVVAGYLLAGGGMEYPNVTVIGKINDKSTLQTVIIHEVGHNWFYGILGSNERDHPWMDEGINSFYEKKIDQAIKLESTEEKSNLLLKLSGEDLLYPLMAKQEEDQAIENNSADYTKLNYAGMVYEKTARMFQYLNDYLGDEMFEKCMNTYYEQWHFKHPYPQDIRKIFEETSGENLNWFFDNGINTTQKMDFAINKTKFDKNQIIATVKNKMNFPGPVSISSMKKDSIIETKWLEYPQNKPVIFNDKINEVDKIVVNANETIPEINISNNEYRRNALFHKSKWKIGAGTSLGLKKENQIYLLPSLGYNYYDQFMLGALIHNIKLPNNRFQFALAPMYSFGSKQFVGTGIAGYSFFTKSLHKITLAVQGSSFHFYSTNLNIPNTIYLRFIKVVPSLDIDFREKNRRSTISNNLVFKFYNIHKQTLSFSKLNPDSVYKPLPGSYAKINYLKAEFTHKNNRTLNPYDYRISAILRNSFLKVGLTTNLKVNYHLENKAFYFRVYLGKLFEFPNSIYYYARENYLNATNASYSDFLYDENYLARNQQDGFLSQQINMEEGGMKIKTNRLSNMIGENDNWLGAINLRSDIPLKFPVKLPLKLQLFFDACTYANAGKLNPSGNKMVYDAGIQLNALNGLANLYVPLLMSKDYRDYGKSIYGKKRFEHYISFSIHFNKLNFLKTQNIVNLF